MNRGRRAAVAPPGLANHILVPPFPELTPRAMVCRPFAACDSKVRSKRRLIDELAAAAGS